MSQSENRPVALAHTPRFVVGYHGCSRETQEKILAGEPFIESANEWDWLGAGVYFWEYAPARAWEWARQNSDEPAVIRARIRLGRCLNMLDTKHFDDIRTVYRFVKNEVARQKLRMPENKPDGRRFLDQRVINLYCRVHGELTGRPYQTVRACFPEGDPVFPGSGILSKTHVQIAVRDPSCIADVRPVYSW